MPITITNIHNYKYLGVSNVFSFFTGLYSKAPFMSTSNKYYSGVTSVYDVIMADTNIEILAILKLYFKLDLKAPKSICRIQDLKRNRTISDCLVQK